MTAQMAMVKMSDNMRLPWSQVDQGRVSAATVELVMPGPVHLPALRP